MALTDLKSSHGVVFKFNNVVYTATNISASISRGEIDATSLNIGTGAGAVSRFRPGGLVAAEIKVDWIGNVRPPADRSYAFALEGTASGAAAPFTFGIGGSGWALATGVSVNAAAGDLIKGSATFKIVG